MTYNTEAIEVYDHDWVSLAEGVAIPHGIYDVAKNKGFLQIGTSRDTSEFACDCLYYRWREHGSKDYPNATSILLLCDGGGSNGARHYIFKQDLQTLVNDIGIEIRIAHYPPYTSKYNPIEHRLFPHLTRATQGVIFDTVETVKDLMATATTATGLSVFTTVLDKVYETGKKATDELKASIQVVFDDILPQWNYTALANPSQIGSII